MEDGFVKGHYTNLPIINFLMVGKWFAANLDFFSADISNNL